MLNEYISLKEQKVMVDQEKIRLEQERWRIRNLLQGVQEVMDAYNLRSVGPSTPAIQPLNAKSNPQAVDPTMRSPPSTTMSPCLSYNTRPRLHFLSFFIRKVTSGCCN